MYNLSWNFLFVKYYKTPQSIKWPLDVSTLLQTKAVYVYDSVHLNKAEIAPYSMHRLCEWTLLFLFSRLGLVFAAIISTFFIDRELQKHLATSSLTEDNYAVIKYTVTTYSTNLLSLITVLTYCHYFE